MPEYVEYVTSSATNGAEFFAEPNRLEWSGPLSIGNPNSFAFQVRILPDTPNGTVITNIAEGPLGEEDADGHLNQIYFDYAEDIVNCPALEQPPTEPMDGAHRVSCTFAQYGAAIPAPEKKWRFFREHFVQK